MDKSRFCYFSLVNTLVGAGIFLLPTQLAKDGVGGYLTPLLALPLLMAIMMLFFYLSRIQGKSLGFRVLQTITRCVYLVACICLCAIAICLACATAVEILVPRMSPVVLLIILSLVLYLCIKTKNSVQGLNFTFFLCFILIIIMYLLCIPQARSENITLTMPSGIVGLPSLLFFFSGLIITPTLAQEGTSLKPFILALITAAVMYCGITALSIAALGTNTVASERHASLTVFRSGTLMLDVHLLIASIAFNLVLLKPAINLGYSAVCTMAQLVQKKWITPFLCGCILVLALVFYNVIVEVL